MSIDRAIIFEPAHPYKVAAETIIKAANFCGVCKVEKDYTLSYVATFNGHTFELEVDQDAETLTIKLANHLDFGHTAKEQEVLCGSFTIFDLAYAFQIIINKYCEAQIRKARRKKKPDSIINACPYATTL